MKRLDGKFIGLLALCLTFALTGVTAAQDDAPVTTRAQGPDASQVRLAEVARGFDRPLYVTDAGDGTGRLFVVEQGGLIKIIENGVVLETPFLDVSEKISPDVFRGGYTERGLLGLAFHPQYATNGAFFINYTDRNGDTVVERYLVSGDNPNVADPASVQTLLTQAQPYANHNGGHMEFGPDGYLYISVGDGGSQGDPEDNAQNPSNWLGTILRIDVDNGVPYGIPPDNPAANNPALAPEVWAYGLRNVWRFSFDSATGDLYLADVGQNAWEEVNFEPADSPGGLNYGWDYYEGTHPYENADNAPADVVFPFAEYSHSNGISVTGGYVYRGEAIPDLQGVYLYGDFGYGTIWAAWRDEAGNWQSEVFIPPQGNTISSFGEDEAGELYLVDYNGTLLRFEPAR